MEGARPALHDDLAGVRAVQAGQDRAERRLARSVLTEEGVNLASAQVEIDGIVSRDAIERLRDASQLRRERAGGSGARVSASALRPLHRRADQPRAEPPTPP